MESLEEMIGFKTVATRAIEEVQHRKQMPAKIIPYSNKFFDKVLGGIFPGEVILIGGETGTGKSEFATQLAFDAASGGRHVYSYFLEADENEMETRMKFKLLVGAYRYTGGREFTEYKAWMMGKLPYLDQFEAQITEHMQQYKNMRTYYKSDKFTIKDFKGSLQAISSRVDLVVLDHIHFFTIADDRNENREMSDIIHEIRRIAQVIGVPIIIIAHLRKKQSGEVRGLVPTLDDFHGSSSLSKVVNTAILFGSGGEVEEKPGCFDTYLKVEKSRNGRNRIGVAAKMVFDTRRNEYEAEWTPGYLSRDRTRFTEILPDKLPGWWNL